MSIKCCQLLAELSGQLGGKIRPLMRSTFGPLVIFTLFTAFVCGKSIIFLGLT
jgi:hypothetical protein